MGEDDLELLEPAIEAARRGAGLIRRLLAFSRQEPLEPVSVDMERLTEGVVGLLKSSLPQNLEVVSSPGDGTLFAFVDPLGLENALLNLSFNARDAMPDGGNISISAKPAEIDEEQASNLDLAPGPYVRVAVADTGSGIDSETLKRVFEPFFTTKAQGSGTGLGLSMVYGFAKQSGGAARITSEIGSGTEVSLYLPRGEPSTQGASELEEINVEVSGEKQLVLLVDDEPDVRRVVRRQLTELGYPTLEASDGETALELLTHVRDVAVLLSDVMMPGRLDGLDLAKEAKARLPELKILLMTAHRVSDPDQSEDRLAVPVLRKPFETHDLARALSQELAPPADDSGD